MLDNDIIEETTSEWSSPVLLVPKKSDKNGEKKWRLVVDYKQLNNKIVDDKFPLPNIVDILDSLSGSVYFSKLDLSQSYYQLSLDENSRKYTAFNLNKMYQISLDKQSRKFTAFTTDKMYQMKRCPMGLKTSLSVFSRLMTIAMSGLNYKQCFIYLDDCIVIGKSVFDLYSLSIKLFVKKECRFQLDIRMRNCIFEIKRCTFESTGFRLP